jgi:NTP pyrophosphatase (non-canonical NTP hydrolase)
MSQQFSDIVQKSVAIRDHYNELQEADGHKKWDAADRMAGFIADVGDLSKLIMVKNGLRRGPENIDEALEHEISDCLWSIMVIADELHIDLETAFAKWIDQMHERIEREKAEA